MSERDEERFFAMKRLDECLALRKEVAALREKVKETENYRQRVIESIWQFLRASAYTDDMKKLVRMFEEMYMPSLYTPHGWYEPKEEENEKCLVAISQEKESS